jgi:hypothetical protein
VLQFLVGSRGFIGQVALLRSFQFLVSVQNQENQKPETGN